MNTPNKQYISDDTSEPVPPPYSLFRDTLLDTSSPDVIDLSEDDDSIPIRAPDNVFRDRLLDNDYHFNNKNPTELQYQRELELALTQSLAESMSFTDNETTEQELLQILQISKEEYENEMNEYVNIVLEIEKKKRQQMFDKVKLQLQRLSIVDKQYYQQYQWLLEQIHNYENCAIEYCAVEDEMEYVKIIGLVKTMKLSNDDRTMLCNFIRYENAA